MPTLRKLIKRSSLSVIFFFLLASAVMADSYRPPRDQVTVKLYSAGIRLYQRTGARLVSRFVHCRYRPTCSEYCLQAARRHGIRKGLVLGLRRIFSCTRHISPGTHQPVPRS
jgi:putative membrane protein insertion efficiency factor